MEIMSFARRYAAVGVAVGLAALLSACFLSPGKFDARMDIKRDGSFRFAYSGEIYLLALSNLADFADKADAANDTFTERPCYDRETYEDRACTDEEIAEQRTEWDASLKERAARMERESAAMQQAFGGIDPTDPDAATELAERLQRQAGWKRVEYKGDGLFDVDFAIESKMHHDFAFPMIERFPMANFFVIANARSGNLVRIDAPGFAVQGTNSPFGGMMGGMAGAFSESQHSDDLPSIPLLDGTFTITTDGEILANNTDQGPNSTAGGKVLTWKVNKRTKEAPTALIQLAH